MTMNSPKTFIIALGVASITLFTLLKLSPDSQPKIIEGVVTNQTLTQSLDGHRRFINVTTHDQQELLIQADPKIECDAGSTVVIEKESALVSNVSSYRLVKCRPNQ